MRGPFAQELSQTALELLTGKLALAHGHARRNARRIAHLALALLPLMALLVGSCRIAQGPAFAENAFANPETFQAALFPDRPHQADPNYIPAAGYVAQARDYVEKAPQTMMLLTRREIGYIFGKPDLQRRDADAEVWQYKAGACVVHFYFYGDKPMSFADIRLTEDNRLVRTRPDLEQQTDCLHDIDAPEFDGGVNI